MNTPFVEFADPINENITDKCNKIRDLRKVCRLYNIPIHDVWLDASIDILRLREDSLNNLLFSLFLRGTPLPYNFIRHVVWFISTHDLHDWINTHPSVKLLMQKFLSLFSPPVNDEIIKHAATVLGCPERLTLVREKLAIYNLSYDSEIDPNRFQLIIPEEKGSEYFKNKYVQYLSKGRGSEKDLRLLREIIIYKLELAQLLWNLPYNANENCLIRFFLDMDLDRSNKQILKEYRMDQATYQKCIEFKCARYYSFAEEIIGRAKKDEDDYRAFLERFMWNFLTIPPSISKDYSDMLCGIKLANNIYYLISMYGSPINILRREVDEGIKEDRWFTIEDFFAHYWYTIKDDVVSLKKTSNDVIFQWKSKYLRQLHRVSELPFLASTYHYPLLRSIQKIIKQPIEKVQLFYDEQQQQQQGEDEEEMITQKELPTEKSSPTPQRKKKQISFQKLEDPRNMTSQKESRFFYPTKYETPVTLRKIRDSEDFEVKHESDSDDNEDESPSIQKRPSTSANKPKTPSISSSSKSTPSVTSTSSSSKKKKDYEYELRTPSFSSYATSTTAEPSTSAKYGLSTSSDILDIPLASTKVKTPNTNRTPSITATTKTPSTNKTPLPSVFASNPSTSAGGTQNKSTSATPLINSNSTTSTKANSVPSTKAQPEEEEKKTQNKKKEFITPINSMSANKARHVRTPSYAMVDPNE